MNGAVLLVVGVAWFIAAYFLYGGYLRRLFGIEPSRPTPAHALNDGIDYVPTRLPVLFGHHFASIAGAGPIVGPVLGAYLGWGPVALWVLLGCVFVGAMHDFAALFVSIRDQGRSIGHVIEAHVGYGGRQIFLLFTWAALVLVVAIFAILVAKTFVSSPAVATASALFVFLAPVFGYLVHRRGVSILRGSLVCVPLVFIFIPIGMKLPLDLTVMLGVSAAAAHSIWLLVLFVYVFVASTIPVWVLLQPRDYLNSYLLYAMILMGFAGILVARPHFAMPAFTGWSAELPAGGIASLFPILFVTVACGACSGFHALVASGTTAKQIDNESHTQPVGYGAMLVEGVVGLMALISVAVLARADYFSALGKNGPGAVATFAAGLAEFATRFGLPVRAGTTFGALAISAFMLTTLDTATRLGRFAWQELFLQKAGSEEGAAGSAVAFLRNRFVGTLVVVGLCAVLVFTGGGMAIWPVFGASNQLLAALTLLVVTLILVKRKANFWVSLLPMVFMAVLSTWALVQLFFKNLGSNAALVVATLFFFVLALILGAQAVISLARAHREGAGRAAD
ncbi:MAG: carbon starvation protein A [Chitinivibrionales bacterium]|nr:carbon starvation protein A [Chitinivibrionales bacterium]MBD3395662.1 carbon starvation protein A [Chitinivibrionales bacterium]